MFPIKINILDLDLDEPYCSEENVRRDSVHYLVSGTQGQEVPTKNLDRVLDVTRTTWL